jgi:hypothetical protein
MAEVEKGYTPNCDQCGRWWREAQEWKLRWTDAALELDALNQNTGRLRVRAEMAEGQRDTLKRTVAMMEDAYRRICLERDALQQEIIRRDNAPRDAWDYDRMQRP